jgi:hypothetical protein
MDTNSKPTYIEPMEEVEVEKRMLTTLDNPFNPFTQWRQWFSFDAGKGYNTASYLARIVKSSQDLSENLETAAINEAIDEILELNVLGIYVAVTEKSFKDRSSEASFPIVKITRR